MTPPRPLHNDTAKAVGLDLPEVQPDSTQQDRSAWGVILLFLLLSLVIEGTTGQMEIARDKLTPPGGVKAEWLYQATSHFSLFVAALMIPFWLRRFPFSLAHPLRRVPIYALGFLIFSTLHIVLMVGLRELLWPLIAEGSYEFGLLSWEPWLYEMRKDVFSYLLIVTTFLAAWEIAELRREARRAREDAKTTGRITLKTGGRILTLPAADILYAQSDGNYVFLHTIAGRHHVRSTLGDVADLLEEAGETPLRLHRSYLTTRDHIRDIRPAKVHLSDGSHLPVGRAYRARLAEVA